MSVWYPGCVQKVSRDRQICQLFLSVESTLGPAPAIHYIFHILSAFPGQLEDNDSQGFSCIRQKVIAGVQLKLRVCPRLPSQKGRANARHNFSGETVRRWGTVINPSRHASSGPNVTSSRYTNG